MAFNVGTGSKDTFRELKRLTPRQRVDFVNRYAEGPTNLLSMLTPQQFAELFPDYFRKGLPDVSGFREAISRKSRQKQDDINFGLSQGAKSLEEAEQMGSWRRRGGGGADSSGSSSSIGGQKSISNKVMARDVYNYLKSKGVDHVHAMGILANIQGESGFRSGAMPSEATMRREGGPSGGLFQHHDNPSRGEYRFTNMVKAAGGEGVWQKNWKGQIDYALTEPDMKKYLARKFDDEKAAVKGFIVDFERPRNPDADYANRISYLNSISSAITSSDTAQASMGDVSRLSSKSAGYFGESEHCVALSKNFSNVGIAKEWKVKSGNITAGTVIATMSYNDGSGGKTHNQMPDGRSHYHTGIALNSPDDKGNVLILDQAIGRPARVHMININYYNGERWGVVEGGEPSDKSMQAVALAKTIANPDQLALMEGSGVGAPAKQAALEVKPVQEAPIAKPTATSTEQTQQYPADQQQTAGVANQQTAKVEKVDKSKKTTETYKFDPAKYWTEVKTKQPMADSMFYGKEKVMQETYKGFEEAQAAGAIKWNRKTNEIQILDPNHEKIKEIYKSMEDNKIDRNTFLTATEAGDTGTAKVRKGRKLAAPKVDTYSPEVTSTGLSKESNLIDYRGERVAAALGVTPEQYNAYREAVASIESSGGKYNLRGGSSNRFSGAYQVGGAELKEVAKRLGEAAPVMKIKGKKTPVANEQFLNDPHMQERYFEEYNIMHHQRLMKNKKYAAMSPEERLKVQGIAHSKGAGAASSYLRTGRIGTDAAGTHPQKYAHRIDKQLAGLQAATDQDVTGSTKVAAKATPNKSTATASVPQQSLMDKLKSLNPYNTNVSAAVTSATDKSVKPSATQRTQPMEGSFSFDTAPVGGDVEKQLMQNPIDTTKKDNNVMNMQQVPPDKSQKETIIDSSLTRPVREFPTDSLARAMSKARGFESGTGADGFHHSTTALG